MTTTKEPVLVLKKEDAPVWRKSIRKEQLYDRLWKGTKPAN